MINGSGAGCESLDGLFHQADRRRTVAGTKETFGTAIERFAGVDGREARQRVRRHSGADRRGHLRKLYAALFANSNKGDLSAYDRAQEPSSGGCTVSTRVPALAASGQKGVCGAERRKGKSVIQVPQSGEAWSL